MNRKMFGVVTSLILFQILDGVEAKFSGLLQEKNEKPDSSVCSFWVDTPPVPNMGIFALFWQFWQDRFLTNLTLLVGPDRIPIKVHDIILATHFEYFRSMFSSGLKESTGTEIPLPCVGPEDFRLILNYAYSGKANATKENVFKMVFLANYFGCDELINRCCNFVKKFINLNNCVKLFKMISDINELKKNCLLFIVDRLPEVNKADLSALPVELLLEIFKHPAAVMDDDDDDYDAAESEKQLFQLLWDKVKLLPQDEKDEWTVKVLKAIHLPIIDNKFLQPLLREVKHIPEAVELIADALDIPVLSETREWYLPRFRGARDIKVSKDAKPIDVNGTTSSEYSTCVLIKGFPFFIYATSPNEDVNNKEYHVASPVAIEQLGLPHKVILEMENGDSEWIPVNTYHNGVVDKRPVDDSFKKEDAWFGMRVKLQ